MPNLVAESNLADDMKQCGDVAYYKEANSICRKVI